MRKPEFRFLLAAIAVFVFGPISHAQTPPPAFSYQALVRDGAGQPVRTTQVGVRIRLHSDSATGNVAYAETFAPTTNGFGNINLSIGRGSVVSGTFSSMDFSRPAYVEVGVDIAGGTTYADLGTAQLLSVPYAMYSARSATATSANISEIRDANGDTRVSTERSPNENIIRFDLNGTEKMRLSGNRLEFANIPGNSIYIGDSAGASITTGFGNLFVGYKAGRRNTTGYYNTFSGAFAGSSNTTGYQNTFSGSSAGYYNTGYRNTFSGYGAGYANTTGNDNTFSGNQAGFANTTGYGNTFSGSNAGLSNTTGLYNTFSGYEAGYANTTGYGNTFSGTFAGTTNSTGGNNTFSGYQAGLANSTGGNNTFSGYQAGYSNTTGSNNTFTGYLAGNTNTTGYENTFTGRYTGRYNTTGYDNTFYGYGAGTSNTTGYVNTFLGAGAGFANSTGFGNVMIGNFAGSSSGSDTNKLYIDNTIGTPLIWGDFAADSVRIQGGLWVARTVTGTSFVTSSDRRLKENIRPVSNALDGVGKISGVYYNYKSNAPDGNPYPQSRQIGVIAQDVEKVYPELVVTQPGGYKAVDYPKLTAVLIEVVKEQQRQKVELEKKMEGRIQEMSARLEKVETALRLSLAAKDGARVAGR